MTETPQPDATVSLAAERVEGLWTLYAIDGDKRTEIGAGPVGAGIMFPVKLLERAVSEPS